MKHPSLRTARGKVSLHYITHENQVICINYSGFYSDADSGCTTQTVWLSRRSVENNGYGLHSVFNSVP